MSLAMICCLSACGKSESRATSANEIEAYQNSTDSPTDDLEDDNADDGENPILIAYFTWADNTAVDNPDSIDVDATASASLLPPGNVAQMASWIQKEVGGDLFSIKVTEPYPNDYDECLERAADEKCGKHKTGTHRAGSKYRRLRYGFYRIPELVVHCANGCVFPLSRKTIFPAKRLCCSALTERADSLPVCRILQMHCQISSVETNVIGIEREDIPGSQNRIKEWLSEIGY